MIAAMGSSLTVVTASGTRAEAEASGAGQRGRLMVYGGVCARSICVCEKSAICFKNSLRGPRSQIELLGIRLGDGLSMVGRHAPKKKAQKKRTYWYQRRKVYASET